MKYSKPEKHRWLQTLMLFCRLSGWLDIQAVKSRIRH